jgi:hypothetical protein
MLQRICEDVVEMAALLMFLAMILVWSTGIAPVIGA